MMKASSEVSWVFAGRQKYNSTKLLGNPVLFTSLHLWQQWKYLYSILRTEQSTEASLLQHQQRLGLLHDDLVFSSVLSIFIGKKSWSNNLLWKTNWNPRITFSRNGSRTIGFISDYNIVSNIGISDVKECCIKD